MKLSTSSLIQFIIISVCIVFIILISLFLYLKIQQKNSFVSNYNGKSIPKTLNRIEIYAHRGGRALSPENTIWAYNAALNIGVDYVDMDINMTKDGILVVYHDTALNPDITRDETGKFIKKPIPIRKLTYAQIQKYNIGAIKSNTKYKSFFPLQFELPYSRIPTLSSVIDFVTQNAKKRVGFQIELKADPYNFIRNPKFYKTFVAKFYQLLKQKGIIDRTEVQSFIWPLLIQLQSYDPNIKTAYLTHDKKFNALMISIYGKKLHTNSIPKIIKALHGSCWDPLETQITQKDIIKAHQYGLKVIPWSDVTTEKTNFNTKIIFNLIKWHVDGLITDRPDALRKALAARNYNVPAPIPVTKKTLLEQSIKPIIQDNKKTY